MCIRFVLISQMHFFVDHIDVVIWFLNGICFVKQTNNNSNRKVCFHCTQIEMECVHVSLRLYMFLAPCSMFHNISISSSNHICFYGKIWAEIKRKKRASKTTTKNEENEMSIKCERKTLSLSLARLIICIFLFVHMFEERQQKRSDKNRDFSGFQKDVQRKT